MWDYRSEAWARKLFDNWKQQLKWQRLKPFERFAAMIEKHWDGIVSYCQPDIQLCQSRVITTLYLSVAREQNHYDNYLNNNNDE